MSSPRGYRRLIHLVLGFLAILVLGLIIHYVPRWELYSKMPVASSAAESAKVKAHQATLSAGQNAQVAGMGDRVSKQFAHGVKMLRSGNSRAALIAMHEVLESTPTMPEAHVNMGYALLGLAQPAAAADFFFTAIELRPEQANAYYGLAVALEEQDDIEGAMGAMRTYLHLAAADPEDHYMRKARSALWEWEFRLQEGMDREDAEAVAKQIQGKTPLVIRSENRESAE